MKKLVLTLSALTPFVVNAQQANVSVTDLTTGGYNANTAATNASSVTYFNNDENTFLLIRNNSTTTVISATPVSQVSSAFVQGLGRVSMTDNAVTIPSNSTVLMGPFAKGRYNTPIYDTVGVSFSALPSYVSVSALRIPPQ